MQIGPFSVNGDREEPEKRVVDFVFSTESDLQGDETIVDSASGNIFTTRQQVRTLQPDGFVVDDIITLVADYLWQERSGGDSVYFTPYFSRKSLQFSKELSRGFVVDGLSKKGLGVKRFDNYIPTCKMVRHLFGWLMSERNRHKLRIHIFQSYLQIFIPMHDNKHWFLLVVRVDLQIAEIWDSLGCTRRRKNHCKTIVRDDHLENSKSSITRCVLSDLYVFCAHG